MSTTPDLLTYGLTSAAASGPVGILLLCAVIYFARRDAKREVLVGGSTRGTHTVASADLVTGIGTIFGISCFASAGQTTDADDVSFDVTA